MMKNTLSTHYCKGHIWLNSVLVILSFYSFALAHPGYGIVSDRHGNIYFTDISRQTIWKLDAARELHAIATGKWSHQIWMDARNNLYFTDEEDINGESGHSFWKYSSDGKLTELIPPKLSKDFPGDIFVIDDDGTLYVAGNTSIFRTVDYQQFHALSLANNATNEETATFSGIHSMTLGPDDGIYVVDGDKLKRIKNGLVERIIAGLIEENPTDIPIKDTPNPGAINRLSGLTLDKKGNIYVCYFGNRRLLKISNQRELVTYCKSEAPWAPVGIAVDEEGVIIKEHGFIDGTGWIGPRIIRISNDMEKEVLLELKD